MRELQKAEALARMKMLGIFPETIKQFDREDKVSISEPPFGAFYWAEGWDLDRIEQFEEDHNALVYLVIRSYTTHGKMDDYLYVSKYEEEWERLNGAGMVRPVSENASNFYVLTELQKYTEDKGFHLNIDSGVALFM